MSQLMLIRHGQASFGAADYDRLSEIGERQARLVGRHLATLGQTFDVVVSGAMRRQRHTAELACAAYEQPPEHVVDTAFDEYDADALFAAYMPRVLDENPDLAAQREHMSQDRRLFQKTFERVTHHWLAGSDHDHPHCEAWVDFRARVQAGLERLRSDYPRDSRIALFSSGGPIAVSIATATEASEPKTIEINWSVYNAAVSELRSTRTGWRMLGFNDIAALRAAGDDALITFR